MPVPTLVRLSLFTVESPLPIKRLIYSRPTEKTAYVRPRMALNRTASIIQVIITIHLLPSCAQ